MQVAESRGQAVQMQVLWQAATAGTHMLLRHQGATLSAAADAGLAK